MPKTDELMTILMKGKDKMVGMEGKITDQQGRELLETGRLSLPMREPDRERVFAVRNGEVQFNDVLTEIGELERELEDLMTTSPLPPEPDQEAVEAFLVRAYQSAWTTSTQAPPVEDGLA